MPNVKRLESFLASRPKSFWITLGVVLGAAGLWGVFRVASVTSKAEFSGYEATHPFFAIAGAVIDGDTFELDDGRLVRLLGINAPDRGSKGFDTATKYLTRLVEGKPVWLEYDRYQDDKYGRLLAWGWIECEGKPEFPPFDYMHLSNNQSKDGLLDNPQGCSQGRLVNEVIRRKGFAKSLFYKDRGELKYQKRLGS